MIDHISIAEYQALPRKKKGRKPPKYLQRAQQRLQERQEGVPPPAKQERSTDPILVSCMAGNGDEFDHLRQGMARYNETRGRRR